MLVGISNTCSYHALEPVQTKDCFFFFSLETKVKTGRFLPCSSRCNVYNELAKSLFFGAVLLVFNYVYYLETALSRCKKHKIVKTRGLGKALDLR